MAEIAAYDLARDIAKELASEVGDADIEWIDAAPYASLDEGASILIIERMIASALKNGGVRP